MSNRPFLRILVLLSGFLAIPVLTAQTLSVVQEITQEATAPNSDTTHPLPLMTAWNNWDYSPTWQLQMIQQGHHILPSFNQPLPTMTVSGDGPSYSAAIQLAASLNLPLSFIGTQWESLAYTDSPGWPSKLTLPYAQNPNVFNPVDGTVTSAVSAFGPVAAWQEMGTEWTSPTNRSGATSVLSQIQQWYPNPPLVLFVSNNEAQKEVWTSGDGVGGVDVESDKHYLDQYPSGQPDEVKRELVANGYIARYRALQQGMKGQLTTAWQNSTKFIGFLAFGPSYFARWDQWESFALYNTNRVDPSPLMWDGGSPSFYNGLDGWDMNTWSPQVQSMNWPFMQDEATTLNPNFWFELSTWNGCDYYPLNTAPSSDVNCPSLVAASPNYTPARYAGMTQFGMWLTRPRAVRSYRFALSTRAQSEAYYDAQLSAVDQVYTNPTLKSFWRNSQLVANTSRPHPFIYNVPAEYASKNRMFLLTTSLDPASGDSTQWNYLPNGLPMTQLPVFAIARVQGSAPNRQWLVYAFSPAGTTSPRIAVPGYGTIAVSSTVGGSFYLVDEATRTVKDAITGQAYSSGQTTPVLTWVAPALIVYGTALGSTQLNAAVSDAGTLSYNPPAGTVLTVGTKTLSVTFTPTDTAHYTTSTLSVSITVVKATPTITWNPPATMVYGTALGATQQNATVSPAAALGLLNYTPLPGVVPGVGVQPLSVLFGPFDSADYTTATTTASITVQRAPLTVKANDVAKPFGAPLPALTATDTGLVNGDTPANLTGTLAFGTTATATSPVGPFSVTPSGVSSPNYTIAFTPGTLSVVKASTTTGLTASPNPASVGQPVTLSATIAVTAPGAGAPSGTVQFFDGGNSVGSGAVTSGAATLILSGLATGWHSFTASYAGDSSFSPSASAAVAQAVGVPQTLLTTQVPANVFAGTYELGLQVLSDVPGQIAAVRFWKPAGETGTHTGHVWNAAGQPLATVVFTNETASGWQQQALPSPVSVAANAGYVVSVNANTAFADTQQAFVNGLINGHLQAPSGANAPFATVVGTFPTQTYLSSNYFRDIVFVGGTGAPDTTPPTVTITQPAPGATVSGPVTIAATAADDVGVAGVQFQVDGTSFGSEVLLAPYSVSWDSTTVGNGSHTLTAIARDAAGHTTPASVTVTVNNLPSQTLLTTQAPANVFPGTYELGLQVLSDVAGQITAVRFWKPAGETGTHVGHVWSATGQLLATVTFANETASGWQQQALPYPVPVTVSTEYVVSVNANTAFADTQQAFVTGLVNGHLRALSGANGAYATVVSTFPTQAYLSSNYFRDIVFVVGSGVPDTTPPTVTITQPAQGATVSGSVNIAATATDDVGVAGVQFQVDTVNLGNEQPTAASYSVTWDSTAVANGLYTLTAIARDAAGHTTPASVTVTVANVPSQTLLTSQVPANIFPGTYELGLRVLSDVAGQITAVRFWKPAGETGTHTGHIWSATGQLLATVVFTNETASGWQQQALAAAVPMASNTEYVVSVNATSLFADTQQAFVTGLVNGHLHALAGANGTYATVGGAFPPSTQTYQSSNYFRDIVFVSP